MPVHAPIACSPPFPESHNKGGRHHAPHKEWKGLERVACWGVSAATDRRLPITAHRTLGRGLCRVGWGQAGNGARETLTLFRTSRLARFGRIGRDDFRLEALSVEEDHEQDADILADDVLGAGEALVEKLRRESPFFETRREFL